VVKEFGKHSILHFATHGYLNSKVPLMSAVALANREELTVSEFIGHRLNASLVVLSACDTGQGDITNGDDIVGFSRALLAAGVETVVASLWPVSDLVASTIMARFYCYLREGMTCSAALCKAQNVLRVSRELEVKLHAMELRTINQEVSYDSDLDFAHPKYWAPFFVIGAH